MANNTARYHYKYLEDLSLSTDLVFTLKLLIWCFGLVLGGIFISVDFMTIPGVLLIGVMMAHGVELQHQSLHLTAFRSKKLNCHIGFLLGIPMLVSFAHYRKKHLFHHRYLGTDKDTEFFSTSSEDCKSTVSLVKKAFSRERPLAVMKSFHASLFPIRDVSLITKSEVRDYRLLGSIFLLSLIFSCFMGSFNYWLLAWPVPLVLVAEPLHFFIEMPEHAFSTEGETSIYRNTRSITGGRFSLWFTNGNNLHVEHHLYPKIPIERLPKVHEDIKGEITMLNTTYGEFFREFLQHTKSKLAKVTP